jgi:HK97 family phage prohead protease
MEFKTLSIIPNTEQVGEGVVTGYLAGFNVLDSVGDIILPGAFTKSIQENGPTGTRRIKHLWMHDQGVILGTYAELTEDEFGLKFTVPITPTTFGKDVLELYRAGDINEHSIGFISVKSKMIPSSDSRFKKIRQLQEVQLFEGSAVTIMAANPDTPTLSVKSGDLMPRLLGLKSMIESGKLSPDDILARINALIGGEPTLQPEPEVKIDSTRDLQPLDTQLDNLRRWVSELKN